MELAKIKDTFSVRKLNEKYIEHLMADFEKNGYQNAYPVSITEDGTLWDGNHRLEAVTRLGWTEIPHVIETPENIRKAAHIRNEAATNALPETFVDHAEEIWELLDEGKKQREIADEIGWSRSAVGNYSKLKDIDKDAWNIIDTTVKEFAMTQKPSDVSDGDTTVSFTEGLLRNILPLKPEQQLDLIKKFSKGSLSKASFRNKAKDYADRNKMEDFIRESLSALPQEYIDKCIEEASGTHYLKEWQKNHAAGPKLEKLITAIIDEYEKKHSYKLICGDISEVFSQIEDNSVDCVITDPPYPKQYLELFRVLAQESNRVLKANGSLVVMVGQSYLPNILELMTNHITYHWTLAYLTPGGQSAQLWQRSVNTFWKPVLWFVKGEYEGKWAGDVCKSDVNDNDKDFHKWGQSVSGMTDLVKKVTSPGDLILDPFCGGGTTGYVSLLLNRKFIGIDKDANTIKLAGDRISELING